MPDSQNIARSHDETFPLGLPMQQLNPWSTLDCPALNRLRTGAKLSADAFGRMIPAENRFASSAGGKGFKPLADKLHAMGLKFGFHYMRGIPRQSVNARTPIENSEFTAADAG